MAVEDRRAIQAEEAREGLKAPEGNVASLAHPGETSSRPRPPLPLRIRQRHPRDLLAAQTSR